MFSIRTANKKDRFLINHLASLVWENTYGNLLSKEQLEYMFKQMYDPDNIVRQMTELGHQYFIIDANSQPSGYLSIEQKETNVYIFQKVYALPHMQGTGIGRYIIEQGISYLKQNHSIPFTVLLYVNRENPAVGFYKHMGFQQIDTRDHCIGNGYYMNDYIMSLEVTE